MGDGLSLSISTLTNSSNIKYEHKTAHALIVNLIAQPLVAREFCVVLGQTFKRYIILWIKNYPKILSPFCEDIRSGSR